MFLKYLRQVSTILEGILSLDGKADLLCGKHNTAALTFLDKHLDFILYLT